MYRGTAKINFLNRIFFSKNSKLMHYLEELTNIVGKSEDLDILNYRFNGILCLDNEKTLNINPMSSFIFFKEVNNAVKKGGIVVPRKDSFNLFSKLSYEDTCSIIVDNELHDVRFDFTLRLFSFDDNLKNVLSNLELGEKIEFKIIFNE